MPPVSQPPSGARGQVCMLRTAIFSGTTVAQMANADPRLPRQCGSGRSNAKSVRNTTMRRIRRGAETSVSLPLCLFPHSGERVGEGSGGLLFRLSALGATELFAGQLLVKRLATVDANLAAFIFSAHA